MQRTLFRIQVDIPALDALVEYLTATQQAEIDAVNSKVEALEGVLERSRTRLSDAEQQANTNAPKE